MPIENERKYVLSPTFDKDRLEGWESIDIVQAYLDDGPRIRRYGADHLFTYKKWVPHARELVEIETEISAEDFDLLRPLCVQSIQKTRYIKSTEDGEWVVDFLRNESGQVYFVLAEVELPRFQKWPETIPAELEPFIVFHVPADDNRFTNKKLSDQNYAANILVV